MGSGASKKRIGPDTTAVRRFSNAKLSGGRVDSAIINGGSLLLPKSDQRYYYSLFREHARRVVWTIRQSKRVENQATLTTVRAVIAAGQRQKRRRQLLADMHNAGGNLSELLHNLSMHLRIQFGAEHCTVFALRGRSLLHSNRRLSPEGGQGGQAAAFRPTDSTFVRGVVITPTNRGIPGCVVTTGEVVNIEDARAHPHFDGTLESSHYASASADAPSQMAPLRSILSVPIKLPQLTDPIGSASGDTVGVVMLANRRLEGSTGPVILPFSKQNQRDLVHLCCEMAKPIMTAVSMSRALRSSQDAQGMQALTAGMSQSLRTPHHIPTALTQFAAALRAHHLWVYLADAEGQTLRLAYGCRADAGAIAGRPPVATSARSLLSSVLASGKPANVADLKIDSRYGVGIDHYLPPGSAAACPDSDRLSVVVAPVVGLSGQPLGVIEAVQKGPAPTLTTVPATGSAAAAAAVAAASGAGAGGSGGSAADNSGGAVGSPLGGGGTGSSALPPLLSTPTRAHGGGNSARGGRRANGSGGGASSAAAAAAAAAAADELVSAKGVSSIEGFSSADEHALMSLSHQVGITLERGLLQKQRSRQERKVEALLRLVKVSKRESDITTILSEVVRITGQVLNADLVQMFLVDEFRDELLCKASLERQECGSRSVTPRSSAVSQNGAAAAAAAYHRNSGSGSPAGDRGGGGGGGGGNSSRTSSFYAASSRGDGAEDEGGVIVTVPGSAGTGALALAVHVRASGEAAMLPDVRSFLTRKGLGRLSPSEVGILGSGVSMPVMTATGRVMWVLQAFNKCGSSGGSGIGSGGSSGIRAGGAGGGGGGGGGGGSGAARPFDEEDMTMLEALCMELKGAVERISLQTSLGHTEHSDEHVTTMLSQFTSRRRRSGPSPSRPGTVRQGSLVAALVGSARHASVINPVGVITAEHLCDWGFDPFQFPQSELVSAIPIILNHFDLCDKFGLPPLTLQRFTNAVCKNYHPNPYHNFFHAFSVMHYSFLFLMNTTAPEYLRSLDVFALLIGALCHDIDHPGTNNDFECKRLSDRALLYNDIAVLENHHAAFAFKIMRRRQGGDAAGGGGGGSGSGGGSPGKKGRRRNGKGDNGCNVFCGLEAAQFSEARKLMVGAILSTDMTHHFKLTEDVKKLDVEAPFDAESADDRQFLANLIVHSADISNPLIPSFELVQTWALKICEEFNNQTEQEKKLGLPVTAFMLNMDKPLEVAKSQVFFIGFIVSPLWTAIARVFAPIRDLTANMARNKECWAERVKELEAADASAAAADSGGGGAEAKS